MRYNFEEVCVKGVVKWKENGKIQQKTRKFYQTINPFNKNADGSQKTRQQIHIEITRERDAWVQRELIKVSAIQNPESK